jgi:hypothetical protein
LTWPANSRIFVTLWLGLSVCCIAGCTAAFGPGYTIEKQEIRVHFVPAAEPHILIEADYQLNNTGNQPLSELELRLPGRRRFHVSSPRLTWDGSVLAIGDSPANARNVLVTLPQPWMVSSSHTLHLSVELDRATDDNGTLSFSSDAFFLPAEGWSPELLPARGAFATGGVPPQKWQMEVRVPGTFLLHVSGQRMKNRKSGGELYVRALQTPKDHYPFVVAGNYKSTSIGEGKQKVYLWTRSLQDAGGVRQASEAISRTTHAYDEVFGSRGPSQQERQLWIVECPVLPGCFGHPAAWSVLLSGEKENAPDSTRAEMASFDTELVDLSGGAQNLAAAAGPSLAASWLGYGKNPAFYEQDPPLSALPAFAAAIGRDAANGPGARNNTIRNALYSIPRAPREHGQQDSPAVVRAKSFLFFYALEDRYGPEIFRRATSHMFYARQGHGFDLDDLISAFDQEAHQNTAQFVRTWMKHPGVPEEFRARYENGSAAAAVTSKEATP